MLFTKKMVLFAQVKQNQAIQILQTSRFCIVSPRQPLSAAKDAKDDTGKVSRVRLLG